MEIYFDWELDEKVEQPIHKWVYEELRSFLTDRYKPLESEIEKRKIGEMAFVAVVWLDDGSIETRYFFIPEDLANKLNEAVTQTDMDYIMNVIGKNIDKKSSQN
jgi:hypothetical protein